MAAGGVAGAKLPASWLFDQGKCPLRYPVKARRKTSRVSNKETVIKLDEVMAVVFKKVSCK
jgi:hypothetical protein